MKIKILTFHCAKNYGAVLQAYALRQTLLSFSDNVSFINYCPSALVSSFYWVKTVKAKLRVVAGFFIMPIRCIFLGYGEKLRKYKIFEKDFLRVSGNKIAAKNEIKENFCDAVVLGSDQIWNTNITDFDSAYFGDFETKKTCKKISYAASIGNDVSSEQEEIFIKENLNRLSAISVREETAKNTLSKLTDKNVDVVLDPVLLLRRDEWEKIAVTPKAKNYILLYSMGNREQTEPFADKLSAETGLEILEVFSANRSLRKWYYTHKTIPTAGPRDFVGLFKNAKYVVTSSFHGTAFSIIFNKQFFVLPNGKVSSRMTDLLKKLNLSERFITDANSLPETDIDYSAVNSLLEAEREKSLAFLKNALIGAEGK